MSTPQRIFIAAWGSRGDLQPVTVLAQQLQSQGRDVLVFGTPPATELLELAGVPHITARENVEDLLDILFTQSNLADRSARGLWRLAMAAKSHLNSPDYVATQRADMKTAYQAAQEFDPDLIICPNIIYGPYMALAEALGVKLVTYDLQINHPTADYPLFSMSMRGAKPWRNRLVYWLKARIYPSTVRAKFHMMREICGLPRTHHSDGRKLQIWPHTFPQYCAVSPTFCPPPHDWPANKRITGWMLPNTPHDYNPPEGLTEFLQHEPVYAGFGSMKSSAEFNANLSTLVIDAMRQANVKGVLSAGWAGLSRDKIDRDTPHGQTLYDWSLDNVFEIGPCPFDWLFAHCSVVIHHGGAGTLATGLQAGRPTIVCAMQGDQPFHGTLVEHHGVGKYMGLVGAKEVTAQNLAHAIAEVTQSEKIATKSADMARRIAKENGIHATIDFIDQSFATASYPWAT